MGDMTFPGFLKQLPRADIPVAGLNGWLHRGREGQVLFLEADERVDLPEHTHGDQWGFVVAGEIDLTIDGATRHLGRGDDYFIPAGSPHRAIIYPGFRAVDCFADPDRYRPVREG